MKSERPRIETELCELRSELNAGFDAINARFDRMQRTMIIGFVTSLISILATRL